MEERIELRCAGGPLLGVLVGGTSIEVKRGGRLFEIDLCSTLALGAPVIVERILDVEGTGIGERGTCANNAVEIADAYSAE